MGVKVATGYLNWLQPSISHSSSSSSSSPQSLASAIPSPSSKRRSLTDVTLVCRYVHRSSMFGTKLNRSRSCEILKTSRIQQSIKRFVSANLDSDFSDEEFSKEIHELALRFQLSDEEDNDSSENHDIPESEPQNPDPFGDSKMEPPDWLGDMIPASVERKASSVNLPFSLRIIQKKKQWEEGFREAGESAYCSMKKAFSSMVFIIRELQSYSLQMREVLFFEDLQDILVRVQKEMNASFVWLFQQVFSHTPTLMVYVMILLANYSVYSMSNTVSISPAPSPATVDSVSGIEDRSNTNFDSSVKTFSVNSGGKTTSVGGINGGGGKFRPIASGTNGDGKFDGSIEHHRTIVPDVASFVNPSKESVSGQMTREEEWVLWKSMVGEADRMQGVIEDGGLDRETMQRFVSPVTAKMEVVEEEEVDTEDYLRTELVYQTGLYQEPDNPLLLANYAQFLFLFARDYKRAENYFKKALEVEPKDAETLSKYANFLWQAKNDMWGAEEVLLEAISADPNNPFYTANYAHFLWVTGTDDICFPLHSPENLNSNDL